MSACGTHLVLVGSPQMKGRCARIAEEIAQREALARKTGACATETTRVLSVAKLNIHGCTGCDGCAAFSPEIRCAIDDDMPMVYEALAAAERLTVVCPLYFAGPPSQFKALADRLQPHFWAGTRFAPKRPASLIVVGEGGDPVGPDPLIAILRGAFAVAGFEMREIETRIGCDEHRR